MDARQLLSLAPAMFRRPLEALLDRLEHAEARQVAMAEDLANLREQVADLRESMPRNS